MQELDFTPADPTASAAVRLRAFPFISEMDKAAADVLGRAAGLRHFPKDTTIIEPGQLCPSVPFVERGRIRVRREADGETRRGEAGFGGRAPKQIRFYDVGPGHTCVLALSCTLARTPSAVTATAIAGTDAVLLPADAVAHAFERDPVLQRYVLGVFSRRLEDLMELATSAATKPLQDRLLDLLEHTADANGVVLLTHADLAGMLGSAREVVSRALEQLRQDQKVRLGRKRIELVAREPA